MKPLSSEMTCSTVSAESGSSQTYQTNGRPSTLIRRRPFFRTPMNDRSEMPSHPGLCRPHQTPTQSANDRLEENVFFRIEHRRTHERTLWIGSLMRPARGKLIRSRGQSDSTGPGKIGSDPIVPVFRFLATQPCHHRSPCRRAAASRPAPNHRRERPNQAAVSSPNS